MPVIGRLDEQVNDVFIEPVGQRRGRGDRDGNARAPADDSPPDAAVEGARDEDMRPAGGADRADGEPTRARAGGANARVRKDEALPVWLL